MKNAILTSYENTLTAAKATDMVLWTTKKDRVRPLAEQSMARLVSRLERLRRVLRSRYGIYPE